MREEKSQAEPTQRELRTPESAGRERMPAPIRQYLRSNFYLLLALGLACLFILWQAGNDAQLEQRVSHDWEAWAAANCKGYSSQPFLVGEALNTSAFNITFNITIGAGDK